MVSQNDLRNELKMLILQRAYKRNSSFKTPTKIVRTYFDFLEISLKHKGVELAGEVLYNEIKDLDIQAIGGPNHGIASILCRAAFLKKIGVFYVRDSIKKEGNIHAPKWIESRIQAGDKVALAGDVISSGSALIRAVESIMELGGQVVKIIIMLDSQEGEGVDRIERFLQTNRLNIPIKVIFTRDEILSNGTAD